MNHRRKFCTHILGALFFCCVVVCVSAAGSLPQGWSTYSVQGSLYDYYGISSCCNHLDFGGNGDQQLNYSILSSDFQDIQTTYCQDPECYNYVISDVWTGHVTGGTIALVFENPYSQQFDVNGVLTWGQINGTADCFSDSGQCDLTHDILAGFSSTWPNGNVWHGFFHITDRTGFVLQGTITFTPEPGSLLLLGSGVLALAGILRRKI